MGRCKTHWRSERGDDFWKSVTQYGLYNYGEILGGPDDRSTGNEDIMKEYTDYISVTDSNYGKELRDSFNSGKAPTSSGNWSEKGISNDKLLYWGESHDTWSNNKDWGFSNEMSQNVIDRAYAVAASRNKVTALYFPVLLQPTKKVSKWEKKAQLITPAVRLPKSISSIMQWTAKLITTPCQTVVL